ncbi:hypothetical protein Pan44_01070 [Caulifigura coniformis]|uniref:Uncharacterized protein n=1 Tax=Caulifigura coniformis TaxID=2527983 RepID=A0A517S7J2_9PLAN|nr:hypothetical protein [Caulifigura coniformis]QDT52098.1 hypothetical protein Pan44_01070 [Caulifigura coniformis]
MRLFSIILVLLQLAVSLFLVGWMLANAGLLQGPLLIVAIGLAGMTVAAIVARLALASRRPAHPSLTEESP